MSTFWQFWDNIAYGMQLFFVTCIVVYYAPKRQRFMPRFILSSVLALTLSYFFSVFGGHLTFFLGIVGFWVLFPLLFMAVIAVSCEYNARQVIYYTMAAVAVQHIAFDFCVIVDHFFVRTYRLADVIVYTVVYGLMFYILGKLFRDKPDHTVRLYDMVPMIAIVFVVQFISVFQINNPIKGDLVDDICYRLVDALCCIYVIWAQIARRQRANYEAELVGINQAFIAQKEQYRMRQEIIDSINRKCHDLKHQLSAFHHMEDSEEREAYYRELKNDIMIYDLAVDTGNEALNTLLMEKGLYCYERNIRLTCMADAGTLSFMRLDDVYAMFGNALDNAIEATEGVTDPEKRTISLKAINQNSLLVVQLQNYYEGKLEFANGLPLTTKRDKLNHGFGTKSIRFIAEKYGGTMTASGKDGIFSMQILLPVGE